MSKASKKLRREAVSAKKLRASDLSILALGATLLAPYAIAADADIVRVSGVIKPKQWTQIVNGYAEDLGKRALIADIPFMQSSIVVNISTTNPDRLETFFRYKRTGVARISSTTAEAGFNFGSL